MSDPAGTLQGMIPREAWLPDVERRRLRLSSGVELALLDWGGGGPLALLHHANGFCGGTWGIVAARLRASHRVVAYDARGHGDSTRPEGLEVFGWDRFAEDLVEVAERLVEELRLPRVELGLGHSFGGTSMIGAAARRPALFGRLVLADPVTPPPAQSQLDRQRRERTGGLTEGARRRVHRFASREEARARWASRPLFGEWDRRALDLYAVHGLRERSDGSVELKCAPEVEATIFESAHPDVFALAGRVRTSTLLLWARRGNFPREVYERLAAAMGDARVEDVDAGHLVPMERPDLVVDAVRRFCNEPSL